MAGYRLFRCRLCGLMNPIGSRFGSVFRVRLRFVFLGSASVSSLRLTL